MDTLFKEIQNDLQAILELMQKERAKRVDDVIKMLTAVKKKSMMLEERVQHAEMKIANSKNGDILEEQLSIHPLHINDNSVS